MTDEMCFCEYPEDDADVNVFRQEYVRVYSIPEGSKNRFKKIYKEFYIKYCPFCGEKMPIKTCPTCGKEWDAGIKEV